MSKVKAKKKKAREHVPYSQKIFLVPESRTSMSAIHAKIRKDGTSEIRLSDCYNTIRWLNDLNDLDEVREMITKLDNAMSIIMAFRDEVKCRLP